MDSILTINNLSTEFATEQGSAYAVRNVDISLSSGETIALVGESGSGKSVIALSILQLLPYPQASHPTGSIRFHNDELINASPEVLKRVRGDQIGIIFQEPMTSLNPLHIVEKQISETLTLHKGLNPAQARARCLELLQQVRIRDPESKLKSYPHQLSGGQRQRVMIAMALANEPEILIADEPTTALDVTTQAQILTLLGDLKRERNMSLILITHDLSIVEKVADRVYVMHEGRLVEHNTAEQVFSNPEQPYTKSLLGATLPVRSHDHVNQKPVILEAKSCGVWFPIKRGLLKRVQGYVKAANDISFTLQQGQTIGVVGESGSGKTSLALALLGLQKARGEIRFKGQLLGNLSNSEMKSIRRQLQVVFQDPYGALSPRFSIQQIIEEGLIAHNLGNQQEREAMVIDILEKVGLEPNSRNRYPHEFSGGQRQRIAIARAMILKPELVILDEPTSALDRSVQVTIIDLLLKLQQDNNLAYIFISHDLRVVRALSDYLIVLRNGNVVEQGEANTLFESPEEPYTRALMSAAFELLLEDESLVEQ